MNDKLTLEQKESIVEELKIRSEANLKAFNAPVKDGFLGAIAGKLDSTHDAAKIIHDDLDTIIDGKGLTLSEDAKKDLIEFVKPAIRNLLIRFIQPK